MLLSLAPAGCPVGRQCGGMVTRSAARAQRVDLAVWSMRPSVPQACPRVVPRRSAPLVLALPKDDTFLGPMAASRLEFRILGPLAVRVDGVSVPVGGPKQRALLAMLLFSANRVVSR